MKYRLELRPCVVSTPWKWHHGVEMCRSRPWTWSVFYDLCICILLSAFCALMYWIHHTVSDAQNVCIYKYACIMPSVQPMNTFSKYELMAQDSTAGLTTRKGILHYEPEHSSWHNRQHVHRPVFYVAGTSHTTRNAISTFSLCNHFPAEKKKQKWSHIELLFPGYILHATCSTGSHSKSSFFLKKSCQMTWY